MIDRIIKHKTGVKYLVVDTYKDEYLSLTGGMRRIPVRMFLLAELGSGKFKRITGKDLLDEFTLDSSLRGRNNE